MDKAYARALELAGLNPADFESPQGRGAPANWGQTASVGLAPPVAVLGAVNRGNLVQLIRIERPDEDARPMDITLAMPHRGVPAAPAGYLTEMVAVVRWGQSRATSYGSDLNVGGGAMQECEIDWQSGTVFTVSGSMVEVLARWDNWTPGGLILTKQVQAFMSASGSHRPHARRTLWHPDALPAGTTSATYIIPGFAHAVRLVSPDTGTIFRVRQFAQGIFQTGSMTVAAGTVSPTMELVNPSNYIEVDNVGIKASVFSLEFDLAL